MDMQRLIEILPEVMLDFPAISTGAKKRTEFSSDPYLRDITERNLEICAQCCIDICHRTTWE